MEDIVDIDLDIDGKIMPAETGKIALIDADTLAFTACLHAEYTEELLPKEFYSSKEWDAIITDHQYDEQNEVIYKCNLDYAMKKAEEKLQRIYDKTGCRQCELYFSSGKTNFRYTLFPEYKANRLGQRPPAGLIDLKLMLLEKYSGKICTEYEADDIVVYLKKKYPDNYTLVAIDKDVYNSIPGTHFNYYESEHFNKEMHWVETDEFTAKSWPYLQTIMGDKTDNIIGVHGIGPKKAAKFIREGMTEQEMWESVVTAYENAGLTSIQAIINMNLVNMHLLFAPEEELEIIHWLPIFDSEGNWIGEFDE